MVEGKDLVEECMDFVVVLHREVDYSKMGEVMAVEYQRRMMQLLGRMVMLQSERCYRV